MNPRHMGEPSTKMDESIEQSEEDLDTMVRRASTPNLATLFKRGKEAGLIKPTTGYGEGAA